MSLIDEVLSCQTTIDYSTVTASPALPFRFTLNTDSSVLSPAPGEPQVFCYTVSGQGADTSQFADLSHFVLGVCDTMTYDDLLAVTVLVDGLEQPVVLGGNVTLRSPANPDPTTDCPGLKFDFSLDKDGGEMVVCITLRRAFAVAPVTVCVKGGQTALSSLSICGPACGGGAACQTTVNQRVTLCVPVTVTPFAIAGVITSECCGTPVLQSGTGACAGLPDTDCSFTITQDVCLQIPLAFGADATAGESYTTCQTPTVEADATPVTLPVAQATRARCGGRCPQEARVIDV